jgi:predicted nucleic acid-binding protein
MTIQTSDLTLLESLIKPLRDGNTALAALYRRVLLNTVGIACLNITRSIVESAANIRALHGLKTADALHAATAIEAKSSLFVTNDATFRRIADLPVAVLSEIAVG